MPLTRTEFHKQDVILPVDAATAYIYVVRAFRLVGTIQVEQPQFLTVFGKITGRLVRRADLTAQLYPVDATSCRLVLRSVSQEELSSIGAGAQSLIWILSEIQNPLTAIAQVKPLKCGHCGQPNGREYRYCGVCGTPLHVPIPAPKRSKIT